ncbi:MULTISPECIES: S1C family serine protease [Dictyoglomus]|jgi:S1-C subfamily serine protease|uniref:2-alkenal reductase n=1 Tax=Dictyoglomus turgidum (strain DSM 6724 / Z-1310) TaxID=515635 RepID=B8E0D4_DICTD|nr:MULTISPECIES: trypsin-like peptidase domain-containing protein [Dictyoglomus]ACK42579.1 2-alkenal reductase [Dictyoglomus turgidum DSM 6724]PNV80461.1 MAG: 2-alkenal reductase [Dictyoglomus turgidum]HBU31194.1 PDZ domain-containing protein [Dictyoglomus sp.]
MRRERGVWQVLLIIFILGALIGGFIGSVGGYYLLNKNSPASSETKINNVVPTQEVYIPSSLGAFEKDIVAVVKKSMPAVVNISTITLVEDFFFGIYPSSGVGSGFIIDPKGYILTNYHVVEGARKIDVTLSEGKKYSGRVVGYDKRSDLAVIKIDAENLPALPLGDSDKLEPGQFAIAIGNPYGLNRTVTLGIVSALNRTIVEPNGVRLENLIQTDAAINPGNSGGPLINIKGEVIGINTAIKSDAQGIGFAIPINKAKQIADKLIKEGKITYPWLGIRGYAITSDMLDYIKFPVDKGVVIAEVVPGSPADKAGLKGGDRIIYVDSTQIIVGGDIITKIDGKPVESMEELRSEIQKRKVGDTVVITYIRSGKEYTVKIQLEAMPDNLSG